MSRNTLLPGDALRSSLLESREKKRALPFIGAYDTFSASVAAKYVDTIFLSGYGFASSYYGLPDEGYITWSDMVSYAARVRHVLPDAHILVDIDDGYGDTRILLNTIRRLEQAGVSAVMFEDQQRPKKCGHLPGKEIVNLEKYVERLEALLQKRKDLFVLARTDANDFEEGLRRVNQFVECGAESVMIEGIKDLGCIKAVRRAVSDSTYVAVNLIRGGKTSCVSLEQAFELGVDFIIYSTPCLFVAQEAMERSLQGFVQGDNAWPSGNVQLDLLKNNAVLKANQTRSES